MDAMTAPVIAALVGLDAGAILSQLLTAGLIAVATGLITANRVGAVLRAQLEALERRVRALEAGTGELREDLTAADQRRSQCELRAAHTYATHAGLARLISDQAGQAQHYAELINRVHERLSGVHQRVNEISQAVAKLGGPITGG